MLTAAMVLPGKPLFAQRLDHDLLVRPGQADGIDGFALGGEADVAGPEAGPSRQTRQGEVP